MYKKEKEEKRNKNNKDRKLVEIPGQKHFGQEIPVDYGSFRNSLRSLLAQLRRHKYLRVAVRPDRYSFNMLHDIS